MCVTWCASLKGSLENTIQFTWNVTCIFGLSERYVLAFSVNVVSCVQDQRWEAFTLYLNHHMVCSTSALKGSFLPVSNMPVLSSVWNKPVHHYAQCYKTVAVLTPTWSCVFDFWWMACCRWVVTSVLRAHCIMGNLQWLRLKIVVVNIMTDLSFCCNVQQIFYCLHSLLSCTTQV